MKKWLSFIVLTTCLALAPAGPGQAAVDLEDRAPEGVKVKSQSSSEPNQVDVLERLVNHSQRSKLTEVVRKLRSYVGKTRYVFSGDTPLGWDCSGLVRWTYENLGISLEHSADKQQRSGTLVKKPLPGDIVAFGYGGGRSFYHTGIYIGNGKVLHAQRARGTFISRLDSPLFAGNKITFTRIIPNQ
jgi:cell wall-associated NlpC family hydrolase